MTDGPKPFDLHLERQNRIARDCVRAADSYPPLADHTARKPATQHRQAHRPDASRPETPRLADVAPAPLRLKIERLETTYNIRLFIPRGGLVDFTV